LLVLALNDHMAIKHSVH